MEEINLTKHRDKEIKKSRGGIFPAGNSDFEPTSEGMKIIIMQHLIELVRDYKASGKRLEEIEAILPDIHILDEDKSDFDSIDYIDAAMNGKWNDGKRHYFVVRQKADRVGEIGHRYTIIVENNKVYITDFFFGSRDGKHAEFIKNLRETLYKRQLARDGINLDSDNIEELREIALELLGAKRDDPETTKSARKKIESSIANVSRNHEIQRIRKIIMQQIDPEISIEEVGFRSNQNGGLQRNSGACEGFAYLPIFIMERALNFNGVQGIEAFMTRDPKKPKIFDFTNDFGKILKNLDETPFIADHARDKSDIIRGLEMLRCANSTELLYSASSRFDDELKKFDSDGQIESYGKATIQRPNFEKHEVNCFSGGYIYKQTKADCEGLRESMGGFKVTKEQYEQVLMKLKNDLKRELQPDQQVAENTETAIVPYVDPLREFRPTRFTLIPGLLEAMKERETERILEEARMARTIAEESYLEAVKRGHITEDDDRRLASERGVVGKFSENILMRDSRKVGGVCEQIKA